MRILFFLEPVIFQGLPTFLEAHFMWVQCFARAAHSAAGTLALAGNAEICTRWRQSPLNEHGMQTCFSLDSFSPLKAFEYERSQYAQALYGSGQAPNALTTQLQAAVSEFRPDLVVMTSQNAFAMHACEGTPRLSIEQAPLPRLGQPMRTVLDPLGHQVGSMMERYAQHIRSLPMSDEHRQAMGKLMADIRCNMFAADPRSGQACAELTAIRQQGPVALLVTQPPDWVTFEGSYRAVPLEGLLCTWVDQLPAGWIGVPTYHPGYRLSESMESALAMACPRLRFLSGSLAQGLTEPLLTVADGMVTISSTSAITGLLFQKPVVVTGKSPFNAWCPGNPGGIDSAGTLSSEAVASTLAFLTHRYVHVHSQLMEHPDVLAALALEVAQSTNPAEWFLDMSGWTIARARSQFVFSAA